MITRIVFDFETYSPIHIACGSVKYASHPDADIVLYSYDIGRGPILVTNNLYSIVQDIVKSGDYEFHAHNALFEYVIWNTIGVKKYGWSPLDLSKVHDTMALANRYGLPDSLEDACNVLDVAHKKNPDGKGLIQKICVRTKDGRRPQLHVDYTQDEFDRFGQYCCDDVAATIDLIAALPADKLNDREHRIWQVTQRMNLRGLPVDTEAITKISSFLTEYVAEVTPIVSQLTNGIVTKITQTKRIKQFVNDSGIEMENTTAETVSAMLARDDEDPYLPQNIRELLELRQLIGKTSTAKYAKLVDLELNGYVYNNYQYYGARTTGRWAGRGFQPHNLPRAKVDDPEYYIDAFKNFDYVQNPVQVAKALIRPMILAPQGQELIVADYHSIENVLLVWAAEDWESVEKFKQGFDQYVDMASYLYGVPEEKIKAGHKAHDPEMEFMRQVGKVIILGCGFGMAWKKFQATAKSRGVTISDPLAQDAVNAYRSRYILVKKLWYALQDMMVNAVRFPGRLFKHKRFAALVTKDWTGRPWLVYTIPSGRKIFYMQPQLEVGKYGFEISIMGVHPKTYQWTRLPFSLSKIIENGIQGTARDVMANGLINIEDEMPECELNITVHDEGGGLIPEGMDCMDKFKELLCRPEEWSKTIPLSASGYIAKRYRKD